MKKVLIALVYILIIAVMLFVAGTRILEGCGQFIP